MTNGKGPTQPVLVYLDTADWAYLVEGTFNDKSRHRDDVDRLCSLAGQGKAAFVISPHHLEELAGLDGGRAERIAFMRSFPGTHYVSLTAADLLNDDVERLVQDPNRPEEPPRTVRSTPLSTLPDGVLEECVAAWERPRMFRRWMASATRTARGAQPKTKLEREYRARLISDGRAFDFNSAIRKIQQQSGASTRPSSIRLALFVMASHLSWRAGAAIGITSHPSVRLDRLFEEVVFPKLPRDTRKEPADVEAIRKTWQIESGSALRAYVSVRESIENDINQHYEAGDEIDPLHATFSSLVQVFTCDKRTEPALAKARLAPTRIIRTGRLGDVADAIDAFIARAAP